MGITGGASFDPGVLLPGQWLYFVVVGYDGDDEGSYGADSTSAPRRLRPIARRFRICE